MADNYLEKRMADYRSGRLSSRRGASVRKSPSAGALVLKYGGERVLITVPAELPEADVERLTALVMTLRGADLQVALSGADGAGAVLAQRYGLRFYPSAIPPADVVADLTRRWGGADLFISCFGAPLAGDGFVLSFPADVDAAAVSRAALFMLHADNRQLVSHLDIMQVPRP